jgi:glycosyltransferase involved in cell wall biosynthesis
MPGVAPLPAADRRAGWSVMVPTYNRADYLETALRSVLAQDIGPEQMQIEVVDNSSTETVRQLVRRLDSPRVTLHYVPERQSLTAAMNLCVARARGQWVHILHEDDFTRPGFYAHVAEAFERHPEIGAVLVRNEAVDAAGQRLGLSRLLRDTPGVLEGWLETLAVINYAQYVSMTVRREVFEAVGAFDERLLASADWDMWKRVALRYPVWYLPEPLACYRIHPGSDTSRLARTAGLVADTRRAVELSAAYLPPAQAERWMRLARRHIARGALNNGMHYLVTGQTAIGWAHLREGYKTYPSVWYLLRVVLGGARRGWRSR